MIEFTLRDVIHEGFSLETIINWEFLTDCVNNGNWRIYYKPENCHSSCNKECDKKHGFDFCALEWVGNDADEPTWSENTLIEILYRGCAYFDGIRHIYFGSDKTDNFGYMNYPRAQTHIEIWQQLKILEDLHCRVD